VNIKEYISSGIVESYVLGLASAEERMEFEQLCAQYPELVEARTTFEIALEKQALENAIAPPASMKEEIWEKIQTPVKLNWWKIAAAACLILLAGSIYFYIDLYNKNKKLEKDYSSTVTRLNDIEKDMHVMMDNPSIKMASLKGTNMSPASFTTVYWDTTSHDVWLLINNLPQPASDKQYQIWALLNGQPIDLGLIDNNWFIGQKKLLVKAKNVQQAQAFAITLESKGGNPTPKGDMYVAGKSE